MDETNVCLAESQMTSTVYINTGPNDSMCMYYVCIMDVYFVSDLKNYHVQIVRSM
jgi:hypothetical protein